MSNLVPDLSLFSKSPAILSNVLANPPTVFATLPTAAPIGPPIAVAADPTIGATLLTTLATFLATGNALPIMFLAPLTIFLKKLPNAIDNKLFVLDKIPFFWSVKVYMTYQNAQFKNIGNDEGDVLSFFQDKMRNLIQRNGGDHSFSWVMEEFTNKDCPMPVGTKTKIKLTHPGHTITQVEKSFVTIKLNFNAKLTCPSQNITFDANANSYKIFIGFKNAVEFYEDCRFWVNGKLLDTYRQDELQRESFAYNSIKPRDAKATAKFSHSIWENVSKYSPSVCGVYVNIGACAKAEGANIEMELTIPFNDQLALQAWQLYPNSICGEIEEEVKTSLRAMVWAPVEPKVVSETTNFLYNTHAIATLPNITDITRKFVQIDNESTIPVTARRVTVNNTADTTQTISDKMDVTCAPCRLTLSNATIQLARSNLAGFGLKPTVLQSLHSLLQTPLLVPAQELKREIFEGVAKEGGLEISKTILLRNATNITMMFPRSPTDITCFENIMYQNVQLVVNKKTYPDTEFASTCDARFYQHQLVANELDETLECTKEFERSFTQPLNDNDGTRFRNCIGDGTSFGINFQLERSNAGYTFDGVTYDTPVTVTFRGQPLYRGDSQGGQKDTYYYPDSTQTSIHPPAPEAWICADTYWIWSNRGIEYHNDCPIGYD